MLSVKIMNPRKESTCCGLLGIVQEDVCKKVVRMESEMNQEIKSTYMSARPFYLSHSLNLIVFKG